MKLGVALVALAATVMAQAPKSDKPAAKPKATKAPKVVEAPKMPATVDAVLEAARAAQRKNIAALRAHEAEGKARKDFRADLSVDLKAFEDALATSTEAEQQAALRIAILWVRTKVLFERASEDMVAGVLKDVPATAWGWAIDPAFLPQFVTRYVKDAKAQDAYLAPARTSHPDPEVRVNTLFGWWRENFQEVDEVADQALAALKKEFPNHALTRRALGDVAHEARTTPGKAAPAFSVASLDETGVTYTLASFKGKYVLVDFWATWCPYCVAEVPALHKVWDAYKDKNFELLSLSCDRKVEDIAPYRAKGNPMPWKHAFLKGGTKSDVAQDYGVTGIPKPVLIGPDGKILAVGTALRGEKLMQTLEALVK